MELPRLLWERVKHVAIDEHTKPWKIVTAALSGYLNGAAKAGGPIYNRNGKDINRPRRRKSGKEKR
jgi:hypothetical protein